MKLFENDNFELIRVEGGMEIPPFDCGDDDLNDYLANDVFDYRKKLLSVTNMIVDKSQNVVVAFYSVSNDKVRFEDIKKQFKTPSQATKFWKKFIPNSKGKIDIPAVKIGRLGVRVNFSGQGIGSDIMDFIKISFTASNKTGCRFITVDAYTKEPTIKFYEKNGFSFLLQETGKGTRAMYYDLAEVPN